MDALSIFNNKKQIVEDHLSRLKHIAKLLSIEQMEDNLNAIQSHLQKERFSIAVVGEFSRGKSTFINALLGAKVLPMKTRPTTAVINRITYGETTQYSIHYREDKQQPSRRINLDDFNKLVAPMEPDDENSEEIRQFEEAMDYHENISSVEINYPSEWCRKNVEIIDTPGVNDLQESREEITHSLIPMCDTAIMLLSATQPLSKSEFDFLKNRILDEAHIKKIFFVVNFKDQLITENSREKSKRYIEEELSKLLKKPKVYLVSSKDHLHHQLEKSGDGFRVAPTLNEEETGMKELGESLNAFLANERGAVKLAKPISEIASRCKELDQLIIAPRLGSLEKPIRDIEIGVEETKDQLKQMTRERDRQLRDFRENLEKSEEQLKTIFKETFKMIKDRAVSSVDQYQGEIKAESIKLHISIAISPIVSKLEKEIYKEQQELINEELIRLERLYDQEWSEIMRTVDKHFSVDEDLRWGDEFPKSYSDKTDDFFAATGVGTFGLAGMIGIAGASMVFALPMAIFAGIKFFDYLAGEQKRTQMTQIKKITTLHFNKKEKSAMKQMLRGWNEKITKIEELVIEETGRKIEILEEQLRVLYEDRNGKEAEMVKVRQDLEGYREELTSIYKDLNALLDELETSSNLSLIRKEGV
ncbi:dynamin family protein [Alkalicoccus chagannorensis]|uniref:dynamin family protein n=1 Tax=Alkalicoccus chagannorensis TaxID=427072 RepID=UPI00040F0018|nr:dynamin family protein [Alkalicoccus chagannorensis]